MEKRKRNKESRKSICNSEKAITKHAIRSNRVNGDNTANSCLGTSQLYYHLKDAFYEKLPNRQYFILYFQRKFNRYV